MTPREIVALAIGVIVGALLNSRREPCRRSCCLPTRPEPIPDMPSHIAKSGANSYRRFI